MFQPKTIYTKLALSAIENTFKKGEIRELEEKPCPPDLNYKAACFVSLHLSDGRLRGCIGTLEPFRKNLYQEIIGNAISAAFKDPRFQPLEENEIEKLTISVDVLSAGEKISDISMLNVKKYGVIVEEDGRRGVLLPNLEGVKSVEEQLSIAKRKAGINSESQNVQIYRFTAQRFH